MALPEAIAVRYTEEEAGYVTFRPVVRQTFRRDQLLDMILGVTGKDVARIRLILHSGTLVYNFYRYWWESLDASDAELAALLAPFPDSDPTRPFDPRACTLAVAESGDAKRHAPLELSRSALSHKGFLQRRSFWDALLAAAVAGPLTYQSYSYLHRGDVYRLDLTEAAAKQLSAAADSLAPRGQRQSLHAIAQAAHILFACPRNPGAPAKA